jgi:hypothetical protein
MAPVLKKESVDFGGRGATRTTHAHGKKSAQIVWLDGRPAAIEFVCACGERSLLELEFDGASAPSAPTSAASTPAAKPQAKH